MPAVPRTVTRFAPSPTGGLHLGGVYSALFARRVARAANGSYLVRIEDIDATRCRPEYAERMLADLEWLGLAGDVRPERRQSRHLGDYRAALRRLRDRSLVYPCFCSRADIRREIEAAGAAPHGPDGPVYPGICRAIPAAEAEVRLMSGEAAAWRLDMAAAVATAGPLTFNDKARGRVACAPARFGDVVLARKDTPTGYHLSVTLDDAAQGVTVVTRGEDLLASTDIHRLLQGLLNLPEPEYWHHPLLCGPDGKRFAKRDKSVSVPDMRAAGYGAEAIREMAECLAGGNGGIPTL